jgi:hypothetical protein
MRIRSNSTLAKLTDEQVEQIYERLAAGEPFRSVQKSCAQPPPQGFGIQINLKTLCFFFKSERRFRHAEELAEARFHDVVEDDPEKLLQNVKVELAHACYDLANNNDPSAVNLLSRVTNRIDRIKLEERRVAIDQHRLALENQFLAEKKRQFNFNAAREAAKHAAKIHKIIETQGPDNEEKIWMVSDIVFGPPPNEPSPMPLSLNDPSSIINCTTPDEPSQ